MKNYYHEVVVQRKILRTIEVLAFLDKKHSHSKTTFRSIPEGVSEIVELIETFTLCVMNEAYKTSMLTIMTKYVEDDTESMFVWDIFFHTLLEFLPSNYSSTEIFDSAKSHNAAIVSFFRKVWLFWRSSSKRQWISTRLVGRPGNRGKKAPRIKHYEKKKSHQGNIFSIG